MAIESDQEISVNNQLVTHSKQSMFGKLAGYLIQPAQMRKILPHQTQEQFKDWAQQRLAKYEALIKSAKAEPLSEGSQLLPKWEKKYQAYKELDEALDSCTHEYLTVHTKEGRMLDTIVIQPTSLELEDKDKYYSIHLLGAAQRMGSRTLELFRESMHHNSCVMCFDYSNVGYSSQEKISGLEQMVADCSAVISSLLEKGVPSNHITLHGFSLGGLVAITAAARYHDNNTPINLYVSCTPMVLAPCVSDIISRRIPLPLAMLDAILSNFLNFCNWGENVISSWNRIPEEYKEYAYNAGEEIPDNFIPYRTTITANQEQSSIEEEVRVKSEILDDITAHDEQAAECLGRYSEAIKSFGHHKFFIPADHEKKQNPHGTMPLLLTSDNFKGSPEELYKDFHTFVQYRN